MSRTSTSFRFTTRARRLVLALAACGFTAVAAHGQGSLTPPGSPAPTMKSLGQIEPRVPVDSLGGGDTALYVISKSGSYYLTANINGVVGKAAIAIAADNVTLDLGGFALIGSAGATRGVDLRANSLNFTLRNGAISGWSVAGVGQAAAVGVTNAILEDLRISGIVGPGINLDVGSGIRATRCSVTKASQGISLGGEGRVENCIVTSIANTNASVTGIYAGSVIDSEVTLVTAAGGSYSATGINGRNVQRCRVASVASSGSGVSIGVDGDNAIGCNVTQIGYVGTGVSEGISASSVVSCNVLQVGNSTSASIQYGIASFGAVVTDCRVEHVGDSQCSAVVEGINAGVVQGCYVNDLYTKSSITGIQADSVTACSVYHCVQVGTGIGQVAGIAAEVVTGSHVDTLIASSSSVAVGIRGSRSVSGSTVSALSNNGTGGAIYIDLAQAGVATLCHTVGSFTIGIRGLASPRITQCEVSGTGSGIGIDCLGSGSGTGSLVDGNNISSCTTGIKAGGSGFIVRNHISSTSTAIVPAASCQVGPTSTATGNILSTVSPWANFAN